MSKIERARAYKDGATYSATDILDDKILAVMKGKVLVDYDDEEVVVVPVRRRDAPHFRRLGSGYEKRVDTADADPTHKACVDAIYTALSGKRVRVATYVFDELDGKRRQIVATVDNGEKYTWWKETQVSLGRGRYIQPDLMGKHSDVFLSNAHARGIVIEVIRTHQPDRKTFFELLRLSALGFMIIFYFIPSGKLESKYNQFHDNGDYANLYVTYYLLDGIVWANGEEREKPHHSDGKRFSEGEWYEYLVLKYFKTPMGT